MVPQYLSRFPRILSPLAARAANRRLTQVEAVDPHAVRRRIGPLDGDVLFEARKGTGERERECRCRNETKARLYHGAHSTENRV